MKKGITFLALLTLGLVFSLSQNLKSQNTILYEQAKDDAIEMIRNCPQNYFPDIDASFIPMIFRSENSLERILKNRDDILIQDQLYQDWIEGDWSDFMLDEFFYDGNNYLIEMIQCNWEGKGWVYSTKFVYTNNASGKATEILQYVWEAGPNQWNEFIKTINTYNGQGFLQETVQQMWVMDDWMNLNKTEYTYDGSNNLTEEYSYNWDFKTLNWIYSTWTTLSYNTGNLLVEELTKTWNTKWEDVYLDSYSYDGQGRFAEILRKLWNGNAWENDELVSYIYYDRGTPDEILIEEWNVSAWVNFQKAFLYYNSYDLVIEEVFQTWETNDWVNDMRVLFNYGPVGIGDPIISSNTLSLSGSPNPFYNQTSLDFTLEKSSHVSIKIHDLAGRCVAVLLDSEKTPGDHQIIWDACSNDGIAVRTGIYFCSIESANQSFTIKLVKQ